jgi:hypothetical protein
MLQSSPSEPSASSIAAGREARNTRVSVCVLTALLSAGMLFAWHLPARPHGSPKSSLDTLPPLVLWAWERPEDLRFIDSKDAAIAFLAGTVQLHDGHATVHPRFQPLRVPDQAKLIAVVRIETGAPVGRDPLYRTTTYREARSEALNISQLRQSDAAIVRVASLPRVVAVQVDFDATQSERAFYRDLLVELRRQLGPAKPISITALASWCFDDDWLAGLPIDEAVPMLFRMGAGTNEIATRLASGRDFRELLCKVSLGVSTDERWPSLPAGRRLYVFNPQPWTQHAELGVLWETHSWH